ncbi:uncharacterized protein EI90DRAFT_2588045 [Cantharellus anzutake]|uniref:uncharacterized protein n=1 Tax=Cantharellus anzutake TaxID=1750568 RepID=UPI0019061C9F|nr:uncharacterized protein EI90DRAFT_2588045 [Cantharellus anzutake]KAF8320988.1 hypothetical protein EI90DRAFT_2588045 [Cantharellus anzutake]
MMPRFGWTMNVGAMKGRSRLVDILWCHRASVVKVGNLNYVWGYQPPIRKGQRQQTSIYLDKQLHINSIRIQEWEVEDTNRLVAMPSTHGPRSSDSGTAIPSLRPELDSPRTITNLFTIFD